MISGVGMFVRASVTYPTRDPENWSQIGSATKKQFYVRNGHDSCREFQPLDTFIIVVVYPLVITLLILLLRLC